MMAIYSLIKYSASTMCIALLDPRGNSKTQYAVSNRQSTCEDTQITLGKHSINTPTYKNNSQHCF